MENGELKIENDRKRKKILNFQFSIFN